MSISRLHRSFANKAWNSLKRTEEELVRLVEAIEALGVMRGDVEVGVKARNIAQQLYEIREVLTCWTQD
jgi:hypothetical protein